MRVPKLTPEDVKELIARTKDAGVDLESRLRETFTMTPEDKNKSLDSAFVPKCERCGAEYEYVKGVYSPGWCQRCGHGSPAELEQRERATKLQWAVEYTLKMMEGLPLTSAEQLQNWLSRARAWARATNPEMRKR